MSWQEDALCRDFDPDLWYPDNEKDAVVPIRVCMNCLVRIECLNFARKNGERFGVWGGVFMQISR